MKKTLIKNADWVITMDDDKSRIKNGDILICDNAIQAVGNELDTNEIVDEVIDARGKVAIPGFVNTHHHCWQSLVRNIHVANGLKLEPWLAVVYDIFQDVDARVVEAGAYVGLGELLKTGCTILIIEIMVKKRELVLNKRCIIPYLTLTNLWHHSRRTLLKRFTNYTLKIMNRIKVYM